MKRFLSYLIILTLALPPARTAHAFAPAVAAPILITAGGPVVWGVAALAALVAAGTAVLAVKWKDASNTDVLEVQLNPKQPQAVPSGWTAGTLPYDAPVPPGTATVTITYNGSYTSADAAAVAVCMAWSPTTCTGGHSSLTSVTDFGAQAQAQGCSNGSPCAIGHRTEGGDLALGNITVSNTCPSGYTFSAGSCVLTDAPAVPFPSDGKAKRKVESGTQTADPRDPDTGLPPGVTSTPTSITVKSGTTTTTTTINPNGTVTVKAVVGNGNGTSTSTTVTTAPADPGAADGGTNATGVTEKVVPGEGDAVTEETVAKIDCGGVPCATEGTQLANKALLQDMKDNGLKIKEDAPAWATQKNTAETGITTTTTAFTTHEGKFTTAQTSGIGALGVSGLSDFTAPGTHAQPGIPGIFVPSAACAPVVSTWGSRSISFDVCPVANFVKPILEWFLYGLAILYVYGAFWRRPQGNA